MQHVIETKITEDGWIQEMECAFLNKAAAVLVMQESETKTYYNEKRIMSERRSKDGFSKGNYVAAILHQEGNKIGVLCTTNSRYAFFDIDYEANKKHLEALAKTWKAQAEEWNKIHRYMKAALNPILTGLSEGVTELEAHQEVEREAKQRCAFGPDVWPALDKWVERAYLNKCDVETLQTEIERLNGELAEVKEVQADILDCLDMDSSHISKITNELRNHAGKWLAHFSLRAERG